MALNSLEMAAQGLLGQAGQGGLNSLEMAMKGLLNAAEQAVAGFLAEIGIFPAIAAFINPQAVFVSEYDVAPIYEGGVDIRTTSSVEPVESVQILLSSINVSPLFHKDSIKTFPFAYGRVEVFGTMNLKLNIRAG